MSWRSLGVEIGRALKVGLTLALILCGLYPLAVWGLGRGLFPEEAGGSLMVRNGRFVGSRLVGQSFTSAAYFHPRPSAAGEGYDAIRSGGSNLGPISEKLSRSLEERILRYRNENNLPQDRPLPADAVTASGSGLDPHISVENALLQARRVGEARGRSEEAVIRLIRDAAEGPDLGILGESRVNVLLLNLSLDSGK